MKARECYYVYHSITENCYDRTARSIRVPAAAGKLRQYPLDTICYFRHGRRFSIHLSQDAGKN